MVGGETLRFVRGMQSATTSVFVTRGSSLSAFSVSPLETTLSLVVDNASFTTAVSLNADVLDRRVYSLAFEPSALGVVANSSLGLRLSLVGADDLLSGEEVSVSLDVSRGSGLSLSTSQVSFDSDSTSVEVRLDAEASASASTVSATVQGELPAGIDVSGAMADVSVLPRELRLSFPSSPLLVLSGLDTSVELTLLGAMSLTATESVGVSLVGLSDSGFGIDSFVVVDGAFDAERVLVLDGSPGIGVGGIDGGGVVVAGERGGVFDVGGDSGVAARVCSFVFAVGAVDRSGDDGFRDVVPGGRLWVAFRGVGDGVVERSGCRR